MSPGIFGVANSRFSTVAEPSWRHGNSLVSFCVFLVFF